MIWRPRTAMALVPALGLAVAAAPALAGDVETLATTRVASGLAYPTFIGSPPGDFEHLYILEKPGRIRLLNRVTGDLQTAPFLDINPLVGGGNSTNDERGLLGLAFHPEYAENGYFYVNYTANNGATTIRRYTTITPELADPKSGLTILTIGQPFTNHNGGWIGFGPNDGYLYIATGDGGSGGDPGNRAQTITNQLLGKMLRIDIDASDQGNYGIPPSNPFVDAVGDDEIWAYGLRNPWRNSFDSLTGDLWIADVGQGSWEEVNYQSADSAGGENYGWRCREGRHNFNFSGDCPNQTFVEPVFEYDHPTGFSITGGYVYRGCLIPSLRGNYLTADYATARVWMGELGKGGDLEAQQIQSQLSPSVEGIVVNQISSFGVDALGEMYIVDHGGASAGQIFRIIPEVPTIADADVNCDGVVNFEDLLQILSSWGPCPGCRADITGDGMVSFEDILQVLSNWSS